ncbi:MAG: VacJ family lipoprotein [Deltaproteobacteria bacterium]|nr:VacJ family lipoprotein [Deltaproteobacteria bacterium]
MKKLSTIISGIIMLMLLSGSISAGSNTAINTAESSAADYVDNSILLAQADTAASGTEDDIYLEDEMMDDLDEPHESIADPLEPINRAFYHFNDKLYFWVLKPAAKGYSAVVPEPARRGVKNFFNNISFPVRFVNCIFQGKFEGAGYEVGRFVINSTLGIAGFMDRATSQFEMPEYDEDLGQTLGSYGIGHGFFLNLPLLGPSSLTDTIGSAGDAFLEPMNYLDMKTKYDLSIKAVETVNKTSLRIGEYEDLKKSALDPYVAYRDAYYQYRQSQIKK